MQIFEGIQQFSGYESTHLFYGSITASCIRIHPVEWEVAIAMRFEILGCKGRYSHGSLALENLHDLCRQLPQIRRQYV